MDGCGIPNIDGYVIGTLKVDGWNDDRYTKDRWIDGWMDGYVAYINMRYHCPA
jgi:hypothetical protein